MDGVFSYILLGLTLSAPIGPVNALQMDQGIKNGFFHSWFAGLGAMTADFIFMLCIFFGFIHLLDIPFIQTFLCLFGSFVLLYTGMEGLFSSIHVQMENRSKETVRSVYLKGFFISLMNPLSIMFWIGIFGSVLSTSLKQGEEQLLLSGGGIITGLFLWDLSMALFSSSFRKIAMPPFIKAVSILSGLFLIGFGLYFGYEGIRGIRF